MKEIYASIDMCSSKHSLDELSKITGVTRGPTSHDIGTPRGMHGLWPISLLRLESPVPIDGSLQDHIDALVSRLDRLGVAAQLAGREGIEASVNIAVMFSTANVSLEIDPAQLSALGSRRLTLEVNAYPSNDAGTRTH